MLFVIASLVGVVVQSKFKDEPILWVTIALSTGGLILSATSGLGVTEMTILCVVEFIAWIFSAMNLFRMWGAKV